MLVALLWWSWERAGARRPAPPSVLTLAGVLGAIAVARALQNFLPARQRPLYDPEVAEAGFVLPYGVPADWLRDYSSFPSVTSEIRHYLSSSAAPPEVLAQAIRRHWAVENGLHWVLDMNFGEDRSRVRERTAAHNLAVLRRIALDLLRAAASLKASVKGKRKVAAWDDAFMAKLLKR